jgi:glycosyltransferase involved in cell wall biosynthesis
MNEISIALVSGAIPKKPSDPYFSFVFDEAYQLAKKGLKIHAIRTFKEAGSSSYGIHYYGLNSSFRLNNIKFIIKQRSSFPQKNFSLPPWTLFYLSKYAANVSNVIIRNKLNIIHSHFAYPEGFVGLLAKKETKRPLVVTVHGSDVLVEPSTGYGIRLNKRYDVIVRRVLEDADAVIASSKATFDEVCSIIEKSKKVQLIPNGVDTLKFNLNTNSSGLKQKLGLNNQFVIFSLRSHEPKYGLEYLIRSTPIVIKQKADVVFIIGGDGSLKKYHEELASKLGVREKFIFTGKIPSADVPFYYALSDVTVVPSLQEAFGLVVSEAMACGKPVIGSNVGGIPDQIVDGYNGFLVEPKDPLKIAERILWSIDNPEAIKSMGINGRRIVEKKYDIEKRADNIISLYKQLLRN